jgi:hypothetical protein
MATTNFHPGCLPDFNYYSEDSHRVSRQIRCLQHASDYVIVFGVHYQRFPHNLIYWPHNIKELMLFNIERNMILKQETLAVLLSKQIRAMVSKTTKC